MRSWPLRALVGVVLTTAGLLALARRVFLLVTVRGHSMSPWLRDGDRVVALARVGGLPLRRGWVVCGPLRGPLGRVAFGGVPDTEEGLFVKRVVAGPGDPLGGSGGQPPRRIPQGQWFLQGDNPGSGDSRHWGLVPDGEVTSVVVARLRRAGGPARGGGQQQK